MTIMREAGSTLGPLLCLNAQAGAAVRLVCFPHAGGGPLTYRKWSAALAPEVEVWTVTLPGRGMRSGEPFATSWAELVADVSAIVEPYADDGPLAFLGHSFGGLVAYEVACDLQRRGAEPPAHLFVSGCRAPHRTEPDWSLPDDDRDLVIEVDDRFGAVPAAVRAEPELLARFVPILRADLELAGRYRWRPGHRLSAPITALAGVADKAGPPGELRHWREHTLGEFRSVTMLGAHFFIHSELPDVAGIIRQELLHM